MAPGLPTPPSQDNLFTLSTWLSVACHYWWAHLVFALMLISALRATFTQPGAVPRRPPWTNGDFGILKADEVRLRHLKMVTNSPDVEARLSKETDFLKSFPVLDRKETGDVRYCSHCKLFKPDRAHHCRVCKTCVLRMDHHCQWINNCAGFFNYKYTFLFFLYVAMLCAYFVLGMAPALISTLRDHESHSTGFPLVLCVGFVVAVFLVLGFGQFAVYHIRLMGSNMTTIERQAQNSSFFADDHSRFLLTHRKYNLKSFFHNLCHFLGTPWMWLLPIASDRSDLDGTYSNATRKDRLPPFLMQPLLPPFLMQPLLPRKKSS